MNPAQLSAEDLAKLLAKAGGKPLAGDTIERQLAAGAPRNEDGTIHLIHYTAWLAAQVP